MDFPPKKQLFQPKSSDLDSKFPPTKQNSLFLPGRLVNNGPRYQSVITSRLLSFHNTPKMLIHVLVISCHNYHLFFLVSIALFDPNPSTACKMKLLQISFFAVPLDFNTGIPSSVLCLRLCSFNVDRGFFPPTFMLSYQPKLDFFFSSFESNKFSPFQYSAPREMMKWLFN